MDFSKPEPKKVRAFSISPATSAMIDQAAATHDVSASRIVDKALEHYLTHVLTMEGALPATDRPDTDEPQEI